MRVAFIQKDPMPRPDLMVLAASVTFLGHEVSVFIPAAERDLQRALQRFAPAVVVYAPPTGFHEWAFGVARAVSVMTGGAPNVFTGSHATDYPEIARLDGVDLVMVGDPETTLRELLTKIHKERALVVTTGTVAAGSDGELIVGPPREATDDIDDLPLADHKIYRRYRFVERQSALPFCTGRGVMENVHAGFAIGPQELARRFRPARRHSVSEAIQRLQLHLRRRPQTRRVAFRDDTLLMDGDPSPWLAEFADRYRREIGLPFSCVARADQLSDSVVSLLAASGCDLVRLGVECGDERLRSDLAGVDLPDQRLRDAVDACRSSGVRVQTLSFLGVPGETTETAVRTLELNLELRPEHAFAVVCHDSADLGPEAKRLQSLLPLVVAAPVMRSAALAALHRPADKVYRALFQLHHDASFIAKGELAPADVLRIAAGMSRRRREAYATAAS